LTITVGDTVHWVWDLGDPLLHNVESGVGGAHDGNFTSGPPEPSPATFDVIFDQSFLDANPMAGNVYPYYCITHLISGMTATITVVEPAVPAASEWGVLVMVLLLLTMGSIVFYKRRLGLILG